VRLVIKALGYTVVALNGKIVDLETSSESPKSQSETESPINDDEEKEEEEGGEDKDDNLEQDQASNMDEDQLLKSKESIRTRLAKLFSNIIPSECEIMKRLLKYFKDTIGKRPKIFLAYMANIRRILTYMCEKKNIAYDDTKNVYRLAYEAPLFNEFIVYLEHQDVSILLIKAIVMQCFLNLRSTEGIILKLMHYLKSVCLTNFKIIL
jgi:hypothetical protein